MSATDSSSLSTVAFYDTHAQEYSASTVGLDLHELYAPFLRELGPRGHILDAGCGSGRDSKVFLDKGYRVTSIDASAQLARLATAFTGQRCRILRFQEMNFRNKFDGIWACASLLHVSGREIRDVIIRFVRALKAGGVFYVSLKEGNGELTTEGGRFFRSYTADSFREILASLPALRETAFWKTEEILSRRHVEPWLNFLMRKAGH